MRVVCFAFLLLFTCRAQPQLVNQLSSPEGKMILERAREEVRKGVRYDSSTYFKLKYPGGDYPADHGVCTDLVVRSFRSVGVDLQKRLHEDRKQFARRYPESTKEWGAANYNVDHRRTTVLIHYFNAFAQKLTNDINPRTIDQWQAGDVVFFKRDGESHPWHIGIVSDKRTATGVPFIVHLFPPHAMEEPITPYLPIHSHFRLRREPRGRLSRGR